MKIICEHCGTNINTDRDSLCPNCKAPYNNNKEYIRKKEEMEKFKNESIEFSKNIIKKVNSASKTFKILFISVFLIGILSFIVIEIIQSISFNNISNIINDNNVINNNSNSFKEENNNIELNYSNIEFSNTLTWNGNVFYNSKNGYTYLLINLRIKNNSNNKILILNNNIICSIDGITQENVTSYALDYKELPSSIESGYSVEGYVAYEVPIDAKEFDLSFKGQSIHIETK